MSDQTPIRTPDPGYDYRCQRCDHQWRTRRVGDPKPRACAKCRSAYWDRPPREKKEGVEPKKPRKTKKKKRAKRTQKAPKTYTLKEAIAENIADFNSVRPPVVESHPAFDQLDSILPPPPHMRRSYTRQESSPMPENEIGRKGGEE